MSAQPRRDPETTWPATYSTATVASSESTTKSARKTSSTPSGIMLNIITPWQTVYTPSPRSTTSSPTVTTPTPPTSPTSRRSATQRSTSTAATRPPATHLPADSDPSAHGSGMCFGHADKEVVRVDLAGPSGGFGGSFDRHPCRGAQAEGPAGIDAPRAGVGQDRS